MAQQPTPVDDLLKLVDACNRCSQAFRTDKYFSSLMFRQFYDRLQKTLSRFIFELEKESSRIGNSNAHPFLDLRQPRIDAAVQLMHAEEELLATLEGYDECLTHPMPTHARAMIQRQRQSLGRLQADLDEMSGATGSASNF
jgi:hypothetical protein